LPDAAALYKTIFRKCVSLLPESRPNMLQIRKDILGAQRPKELFQKIINQAKQLKKKSTQQNVDDKDREEDEGRKDSSSDNDDNDDNDYDDNASGDDVVNLKKDS